MYKNERRMFDRFAVDFLAEIKQPAEKEAQAAQCYDVSATGVGVALKQMLLPNTKLEIWLGVPDGHPPFRGVGRVVWSAQVRRDKWHSGLEFETADFMGVRRIFDILSDRK